MGEGCSGKRESNFEATAKDEVCAGEIASTEKDRKAWI
jgi:hypothetical protein